MREAGQDVGSFTVCKGLLIAPLETSLRYTSYAERTHGTSFIPRCWFHHVPGAAQAAISPSVEPLEDNDEETGPSLDVASVGDELEEQGTEHANSHQKSETRETFKIGIPKVNIQSAIETMRLARTNGLPSEEIILGSSPQTAAQMKFQIRRNNDESLAARMKTALLRARKGVDMKATMYRRGQLPLMAGPTQKCILSLVNDNDIAIILAKTGSGKTTQVPQILLDDMIMSGQGPNANVVCTQPRRIAATSVATRVAQERHDATRRSVGHHIRNENLVPKAHGSITYCTTGILLNRLISDADRTLSAHSHIIVDEVHERDIQIDLVLSLLRNAILARKTAGKSCPKILLMSATIDPSTFLDYLTRPADDGIALTADYVDVEGSHAEIEDHYLPEILQELAGTMLDYIQSDHLQSSKPYIWHEMQFAAMRVKVLPVASEDSSDHHELLPGPEQQIEAAEPPGPMRVGLAASVIAHIAASKPEGDILAFFPGASDMENAVELLRGNRFVDGSFDMKNSDKFRLFKLHSMLKDTNNEVFDPVPEGCRRIILATNIAETSITIPGVVYVVDTGKERSSFYDHATLARSLPYVWISKTSAIQRRGRTGRVRSGHYYALFTKERFDSLRPMSRPQIGQSDLAEVVLQFKAFPQLADVEDLLLDTMDPPSRSAVANAMRTLQSLSALTESGNITSLGRLLSQLGIHPTLGKSILLGCLFGCLEPLLIIACHDPGAPLISNLQMSIEKVRKVKSEFSPEAESDFTCIIEAFKQYHAASLSGDMVLMEELARTKYVRHRAYVDMITVSGEIHNTLARIGFVPAPQPGKTIFEVLPPALNANRNNMVLVKALLISTVSAELAIWPGTEMIRNYSWSIDSPILKGLSSRQGVNEVKPTIARRLRQKYRSYGRLMAYTYKREAPDTECPRQKVFLEQASMITPIIALLFCQSLTIQQHQTVELNKWLRLQFSAPTDISHAIADQVATILFELRKTIDRFMSLAWLELENLDTPKGGNETSNSSEKRPSPRRLGLELRKVMVEAVLNILKEDEAYWSTFRSRRRIETAAEIERLEKLKNELAEADTQPEIDTEDYKAEKDEYELEVAEAVAYSKQVDSERQQLDALVTRAF